MCFFQMAHTPLRAMPVLYGPVFFTQEPHRYKKNKGYSLTMKAFSKNASIVT